MDEIVQEFLIESYDSLDQLERDLVSLEQAPTAELLAAIFRNLHTIKGCCGYLGFEQLAAVSHAGESLLGLLREGSLEVDAAIISTLLGVNDAIRVLLGQIEQTGAEGVFHAAPLLARIEAHLTGVQLPAREGGVSADLSIAAAVSSAAAAPLEAEAPDDVPVLPTPAARAADPESSTAVSEKAERGGKDDGRSVAQSTIRVDVGLLDELMNLVGELVLARNQLIQHLGRYEDTGLQGTGQRLSHITTELQARIMKTRMQPIGNVWHKLPRLVRDTAGLCGKQVSLRMEGQETELDRTILEAIKDPLTHVVRNAIDHGLETPERRRGVGKIPEGRLTLRAFHEGGQVNIEIQDDGGGVNLEKVRQRARERGLFAPDVLARMSNREITQLIFHPGFSTAEAVTSVSGRGVGMDVVKTNIEKIGGQVEIDSAPGVGTAVKIRIPLTLAIIPALIVTCAGQRFALPQVSLDELVRLEGDASNLERVRGTPVYRLRGKLLPIVYLHQALGLPAPPPPEDPADREINIVILQGGDQRFGLVVDAILDTEEIVVKPLSNLLKGLAVYSGATIMGDGRVALILDAQGLAAQARLQSGASRSVLSSKGETAVGPAAQTLLLMRVGSRRLAMPLSAISRLEEFSPGALERVGRDVVVQYRGGILPLLPLSELLGGRGTLEDHDGETLRVVVRAVPGGAVGLVVDQILDIVSEAAEVHTVDTNEPLLGYAVIQSRVTELVDVDELLRRTSIALIHNSAA